MAKKISIKDVAKGLGISEQQVRIGLRRNAFPFGTAYKGTGKSYNYVIYPNVWAQYIKDVDNE